MAEPGYNLLATPWVVRFFLKLRKLLIGKWSFFYTFLFRKMRLLAPRHELKCSESGLIEEREYSEVFHKFSDGRTEGWHKMACWRSRTETDLV